MLVAKSRGIKGYKSMSEVNQQKVKRDRFSKPQINEIRKNLYDIKYPKNLSTQKIKEIKENLFELEKSLSNFKKYRFQDDFEQKKSKRTRKFIQWKFL